jgi:LysR family cyn operon transcriptional activator
MDLRQLEMFLAVVDSRSFTAAGRQLHVAQSAISRKVKLLEEELGERLFIRAEKKLRLTGPGETLVRHARKVFQDLRTATLEISDMTRLQKGHLRIAAGITQCAYMLPPVLKNFRRLYPGIELEVVTGALDVILPRLRSHDVEMLVATLPVPAADCEVIPLCEEELVVVTSTRHPGLFQRRVMDAAEFAEHRLILFSPGTRLRGILDRFFENAGITPRILMEADTPDSIKPFVRIDLGISILPLPIVSADLKRHELHALRIRNHKLSRQIGLVHLKSEGISKVVVEMIRLFKTTKY